MSEENGAPPKERNNLVVLPPGDVKPDVRIPNELLTADPETLVGRHYVFMRSGPLVYTLVPESSLPKKVLPEDVTAALDRSTRTATDWRP